MRILYFSKSYTPHDYRFLSSLSQTEHQVYFLQLETAKRQTEDRPVPENVQQIPWAGGKHEFRWRDVPRLSFDFQGDGSFGPAGATRASAGELVVYADSGGELAAANAGTRPLELMLLGGAPDEGPLVFHGPFVMNSVEQARAAEVAYRTGRMGALAES